MPGSLSYSQGNYSALSDISGRSLDSGAKKVSFNKAVRVKQYPWKLDYEDNNEEHLTLPSNRFWFKVYRSKHDSPDLNNASDLKTNTWTEDKVDECNTDSLAPIEEVEDYDLYSSNSKLNSTVSNGYYGGKMQQNELYSSDRNNKLNNQLTKTSLHSVNDRPLMDSNRNYYNGVLKDSEVHSNSNGVAKSYYNSNGVESNGSAYKSYTKILEESENNDRFNDRTQMAYKSMRLPRMSTRYESPLRRSGKNFDTPDDFKTRQRSRSYDPVEESQFRLRKADKSVSTEDLNFNQGCRCFTNKFLTGSRDMGTQCNGTLTRDKIITPRTSSFDRTEKSEEERLNNFVSPTESSKKFDLNDRFITSDKQLKTVDQGIGNHNSKILGTCNSRIGNYTRLYEPPAKSNFYSTENNMINKKNDYINGKLKKSIENLNGIGGNRIQNTNMTSDRKPGSRVFKDDNQTKTILDSTTPGYLRERKQPLGETNFNTNRKYIKKNEQGSIQNYSGSENKSSYNVPKHDPSSLYLKRTQASNLKIKDIKNDSSKKYPQSVVDNSLFTNLRTNMGLKHDSSRKHNVDNSMIDWTNSGFQLSPRPETTSVSGPAYTVHKTSPLLMYIPGISHHECPAVDDDRLSHLSDLSRSDLGSVVGKDSNFRRSYSMRDGKSKWNRWK